jgi:nicotinic acid phosphoribosyltransferase
MTSLLRTDGYKFSMAQAGFPLRPETFYFSFRRGGWQLVPFDLAQHVRSLLPRGEHLAAELSFLEESGYGLTPAMREALAGEVSIKAVPAGAWVHEREPILTVSGPSFLLSWLEPLLIRLFFPIQLATAVARDALADTMLTTCCEQQAQIAARVFDALGRSMLSDALRVEPLDYQRAVTKNAERLVEIVGSPDRVFEVGMRGAVCEEQHRLALSALRDLGIKATSNVEAAHELDMRAVGTMGHEHVQRWGNDLDAYRAMRDMRIGAPSYLLDTFDTMSSGIPAAITTMRERPHPASIRYDSGDKFAQYMFAHGEMQRADLQPTHILEDGLDEAMTRKFEELRGFTQLGPQRQLYGYGGHLIARPLANPLSRNKVSAVYKLSQTAGQARMKFGNEEGLGKVSVPGVPVAWRRIRGSGPLSIIAQAGEPVPDDYVVLNGNAEAVERLRLCNVDHEIERTGAVDYVLSPATRSLVQKFQEVS